MEQLEELKEAFTIFDTLHRSIPNKTLDALSAREFKSSVRALGVRIRKKDVDEKFAELEKDLSDTVTLEEYIRLVKPLLPDRTTREGIMNLFKMYDVDKAGKISLANLKRIAMEIGENISDDELETMFKEADKDNDGVIGPEDFYRVIKRTYSDDLIEFE
eukprot:TRINITY_DN15163_c0_g3_i1.p1 TRINITY_DN15163_c0_g3~~TRINITY_DN15163_c0_g3_i1.p1  ORF type:complete len:160 (-),score=63.38 TRINITY_DN15163_c0_g3_i1:86-565(-)